MYLMLDIGIFTPVIGSADISMASRLQQNTHEEHGVLCGKDS